ncbi:MAG: YggS family pyridoxal phosphate-dependent enzyme [Solobacterium sp.]|nr:YggS family pyridoxal phosphate-dependent enzyme [Solobacterium sp.]
MIQKHYEEVKRVTEGKADLCIVTKKRSLEEIMSYYDAGERVFGENHAQELKAKAAQLPCDIRWQFIGHLQRNKVKDIIRIADCIQSLDSIALADVIEKEAAKAERTVNVLAEFHLASEDTSKTGLSADEAENFIEEVLKREHLKMCGIMVMGPHTDDEKRIAQVFEQAHTLFENLQSRFGPEAIHTLSMGMSDDYKIAVSCGSTLVRIGTYLFEE